MAISLAARMILKKGSLVLVGEPSYLNANLIFQEAGASLERIPVDENGMDVEKIGKICRRKKPDLLYIIPHHHHPTTVTLSADRRMKLLELINTYQFPVIEDDYDYDFHYGRSPILPLASADHGSRVIYIGSFSKILSSSIRIGFMVAPENFIQGAATLRRLVDIRGDILLEEALAELFRSGAMQRHIRKAAKLYNQRRDRFCTWLADELGDKISFNKPPGGMAAWVAFDKQLPLTDISTRASSMGLFMSDGSFYNTGPVQYNALRMGFASLNEVEMAEIIGLLGKLTRKPGNRP
jgi:GntR family transcriptional regulator/MocR family aminotransferase